MLDRGADIEARDTTWDATPLGWAGASTVGVTLAHDDPKPPSPQVAELLRGYGIGGQ